MTVQCIDCAQLDLQANKEMARHGFGQCRHLPAWQLRSIVFPRECDKFKAAPADRATKRREFFKQQKEQQP